MRVLRPRKPFLSTLSKKAAVIDIDIIVAYLLFISTIILMINYALGLTAPFSTSIESIEKEKNTIAVRDGLKTRFGKNEFNSLCNVDYINLRRFSVTYEVMGFEMPYTDSEHFTPSHLNGSVVFWRENEVLHVATGSNASSEFITVEVVIPEDASVSNISLESSDSFSVDYDSFNNLLVILDSAVSDGDVDEITIKPVRGVVSFRLYGVNQTSCYIGLMPVSDYCGTRGIVGARTSFNRYGLMTDERTEYYIKLLGDIWWTG